MNLKQLPYLPAIAETGSLSAAAKKTGISQPALSKYLTSLEEDLGMPLFARSGHKMVPTEAGLIYLRYAKTITDIEAKTKNGQHWQQAQPAAVLHVGVYPGGIPVFAGLLPYFDKQFPDVRPEPLTVETGRLLQLVRRGTISGAFGMLAGCPPKGIRVLPVCTQELVLCEPAYYPLTPDDTQQNGSRRPLSAFADLPFILTDGQSPTAQATKLLLEETGVTAGCVYRSENVSLNLELTAGGKGVTLLPEELVRKDARIRYYRLSEKPLLTLATLWPEGHMLADTEKYLHFLFMHFSARCEGNTILWTEENREILQLFDDSTFFRAGMRGV